MGSGHSRGRVWGGTGITPVIIRDKVISYIGIWYHLVPFGTYQGEIAHTLRDRVFSKLLAISEAELVICGG